MNYNKDEVMWVSQTLMSYKDKKYHSDGYFELSVSSTTKDYINFSQPRLTFSIDNENKRRISSLSIINVLELLDSFNEVSKNISDIYNNPQSGDITKRFNKNRDLVFCYRLDQNTNEPLVKIKVSFGYSDEGIIIVPYNPEYIIIGRLMRTFYDNYDNWCLNLPTRFINGNMLAESKLQTTLIKTLPSQIVPVESSLEVFHEQTSENLPRVPAQPTEKEEAVEVEVSMETFSKFIDTEEDKAVIPEFKTTEPDEKPKTQEYKSNLIDNILEGDIKNFESLLSASISSDNPTISILKTINSEDEMRYLPTLSDNDKKSTFYITNYYFKIYLQNLINNGTPLPVSIPVTKYTPSQIFDENKELAYDICMINCYLKSLRGRLETTNPDCYSNGAMTYFISRCFLDIVTSSFLSGNLEIVKNSIVSRFSYYKEKGFFEYYENSLHMNNCNSISEYDIGETLEYLLDSVSTDPDINTMHNNAFENDSVYLPPKNKFTSEQILNDIVNIEVRLKFGNKIEDLTENEDYIELFKPQKKKKKKTKTESKPLGLSDKVKKETHILRWVKFKLNEVPEKIQKKFIKHITEMKEDDYIFSDKFQDNDFGENIIKGLYTWNAEAKKGITYTDFAVKIEECIDKNLIMSKLSEIRNLEDTTGSENGDWY